MFIYMKKSHTVYRHRISHNAYRHKISHKVYRHKISHNVDSHKNKSQNTLSCGHNVYRHQEGHVTFVSLTLAPGKHKNTKIATAASSYLCHRHSFETSATSKGHVSRPC